LCRPISRTTTERASLCRPISRTKVNFLRGLTCT
jgi:hypothetical protein